MENVSDLVIEYVDDNEGLSPQEWLTQYDLNEDEREYFFSLLKMH